MPDYSVILQTCRKNSEISASLLDDFLINFCADREGLEKLFMDDFKPFRYMTYTMPEGWVGWTISQYIAYRLFRKGGTASEYYNLPEIAARKEAERDFMKYAIEHPWKYTFFSVVESHENHLYTMLDVLENETFLLYSPSITEILNLNDSIQMFFNLLSFNGRCWQSFGLNSYFTGFITSDLLYFAKNLDEDITFLNQIPELIDYDPIPWLVLFKSAEIPLAFNKKDMIIINSSEYYEVLFACSKMGAILNTLNWRLAVPEMEYILNNSEARVLLVGEEYLPALGEMNLEAAETIVVLGDDHSLTNEGSVRGYTLTGRLLAHLANRRDDAERRADDDRRSLLPLQ